MHFGIPFYKANHFLFEYFSLSLFEYKYFEQTISLVKIYLNLLTLLIYITLNYFNLLILKIKLINT